MRILSDYLNVMLLKNDGKNISIFGHKSYINKHLNSENTAKITTILYHDQLCILLEDLIIQSYYKSNHVKNLACYKFRLGLSSILLKYQFDSFNPKSYVIMSRCHIDIHQDYSMKLDDLLSYSIQSILHSKHAHEIISLLQHVHDF